MGALLLGGVACLAVLAVVAIVLPARIARVLGPVLRLALVLALPLAVSVAVVNVLFTPGGSSVVATIGPLRVTGEGIAVAAVVVVRVLILASAVSLFYMTTRPAALMASLQHHGLPPRLAFVVHGGVAMVPHLAERAREVVAAQRARGLDTEGSLPRRARGILALATPTVLGAFVEVETRTLALESRAFSRPGPHTVLRVPHDSTAQRLVRWMIVAGLGLLAVVRLAGMSLPC